MAMHSLLNVVWQLGFVLMAATALAAEGGGTVEAEIEEKLTYRDLEVSISQNTGKDERAEMAEPAEALEGFVAKKLKSQGSAFHWSPDGRYLYSSDKTVRLSEYPTFRQLRTTQLRGSVHFCSRGLCVYEGRGAVAILDHETLDRKLGWAFPDPATSFRTSPGSRYAICSFASAAKSWQVVNLSRGTMSKPFAPMENPAIELSRYRGNLSENLEYLSFASDGKHLFAKATTNLYRFRFEGDRPALDYVSHLSPLPTGQTRLAFSGDSRHILYLMTSERARGLGDGKVLALVPVDAPEAADRIVDVEKGTLHQYGIDGAGNVFTICGEYLMMAAADDDKFVRAMKIAHPYQTQLVPHPTQAGAVVYETSRSFAMWVAPADAKPSVPTQRWVAEIGRDEKRP